MKFATKLFRYSVIQHACESLGFTHTRPFLRFDSGPMEKQLIPDTPDSKWTFYIHHCWSQHGGSIIVGWIAYFYSQRPCLWTGKAGSAWGPGTPGGPPRAHKLYSRAMTPPPHLRVPYVVISISAGVPNALIAINWLFFKLITRAPFGPQQTLKSPLLISNPKKDAVNCFVNLTTEWQLSMHLH